ncbi:MAG: ferrous iron transport protein B [Clostridiales bacterium]|nr:ferrous iron transport protein B [Clostridiales bacterium]
MDNSEKRPETRNSNELRIAFIGNPNCGKTTLFNAYTGANLKVANWPGVTVEKKEGSYKFQGHDFKLIDLPGIYSLTSYTMEERVSRMCILSDEVDVIIDVTDASALERNMYLTMQLIELGKPVVMALNMMDIVEERGMEIDLHRMQEMLGIPVIPVSARKKTGLESLMHAALHHKDMSARHRIEHHHKVGENAELHQEYALVYSDKIEAEIARLSAELKAEYPNMQNPRWHAIKYLEGDADVMKDHPLPSEGKLNDSRESAMINEKYDFIEEVIGEVLVNKDEKSALTDKVDRLLTHRIWGIPIFLCIMAAVFALTFTLGDWLKGYFEMALESFSGAVSNLFAAIHAGDLITSLIVDGIIAGVGGILTFLPNIVILFFALAILEDSGYMSRVAYVMDGLMGSIGLSGRAFIPMLLGFGCTVPAVMASRALEDKRDRLKTIFVTPFMSCSARLPVYVLLSQMFFGKWAGIAAFSMYLIGLIMAIVVAKIVSKCTKKYEAHTLLIELPEYKTPNAHTIFIYVWDKIKDYLTKAGTTIFLASILLWFLLNFGMTGLVEDMSQSFAAMIAKFIEPIMRPTGLGYWQIIVALISGIAAKEVVVSSMSVLFGIGNIASAEGMAALSGALGAAGFGAANAYAMMIFVLLYIPCAATIATIRRESGSTKFTLGTVAMQLGTAWIMSAVVYNVIMLFI